MPLTHVRALRVRHYECGPDGLVRAANYLRYMQEAAFDASAAAGYDMERYEAMGCHWLIRETEIEYHRSLRYGQEVEVKTWVADFRRVRSRRAYEFRLPAEGGLAAGALVARAHTDWVFLDTHTLRPATIPDEMRDAFFPEGPPTTAPPRDRFPDVAPPAGAFRQQRRVERRDLDPAGHVNNCVYVDYVQECGRLWAAAEGREPAGIPLPRHCRIEYRLPALPDDEMELVTWLEEDNEALPARYTFIHRPADGALLARARSVEE
ncbi:MAG: thioesterase [Anaerolineae bacterium]